MRLVFGFVGKKDLSALRDIYFRKKEKLFGGMLKIQGNTAAMEALTKECFKDQLMSSVTKPKYDILIVSFVGFLRSLNGGVSYTSIAEKCRCSFVR